MGVNVVKYGGKTLVDMTDATATAETVLAGYKAYGSDGELVIGTLTPTVHKTVSVTLSKSGWVDNVQTVDVDFATADAMVIAGGAQGDQEYLDCEVWCSGQDDGLLTFSCTYEPMEDVIANIGLLLSGDLVISFAHGSVISLNNSSDRKLRGLTLYGKTTQDGTPTPGNPVELVSAGDGGSVGVTACGKNLFSWPGITEENPYTVTATRDDYNVRIYETSVLMNAGEEYTFSIYTDGTYGNTSGADGVECYLLKDGGYDYIINMMNHYVQKGNRISGTFVPAQTGYYILRVDVNKNGMTHSFWNAQIEKGSTETAYEPYKGQTITVSTPNGLPGIPMTSGGNYTDENGQQWVCDEVDFGRGKHVQRVVETELIGNEPGWSLTSSGNEFYWDYESDYTDTSTTTYMGGCCNQYLTVYERPKNDYQYAHIWYGVKGGVRRHMFADSRYATLAEWKNHLAELYSAGNPVVVLSILATPIETDLTAEQLTAYAALHTNYPNTTIYNDAGAGMAVRYVVA